MARSSAEDAQHFLVRGETAGRLLRIGEPPVHRDLEHAATASRQADLGGRLRLRDDVPRRTGARFIASLTAIFDVDLHAGVSPVLWMPRPGWQVRQAFGKGRAARVQASRVNEARQGLCPRRIGTGGSRSETTPPCACGTTPTGVEGEARAPRLSGVHTPGEAHRPRPRRCFILTFTVTPAFCYALAWPARLRPLRTTSPRRWNANFGRLAPRLVLR